MQLELKTDRLDECSRIGRELGEVERRRNDLFDGIRQLETTAADVRSRVTDIESQLVRIQLAEDTALSARSKGPAGTIAGTLTALVIRLATQKDQLEREKHQAEDRLSRIERKLDNDRRRSDQITHIFNRLNSAFADLNYPLGLRDFG